MTLVHTVRLTTMVGDATSHEVRGNVPVPTQCDTSRRRDP